MAMRKGNKTPVQQAPERVSNLVKNYDPQQCCLDSSGDGVSIAAPSLTWDEWRMAWVTLQYRLCKTQKDDPKYADLERLCKKIAPVLAEGFGS